MKAWQLFILLSAIVSNGHSEYRMELSAVGLVIAVIAMIFPPKSEQDKS